ncbi:MAG: hypothetical protein WA869_16405 [Alloacidobacterium sp.]|jgi:hypothetical protein
MDTDRVGDVLGLLYIISNGIQSQRLRLCFRFFNARTVCHRTWYLWNFCDPMAIRFLLNFKLESQVSTP